MYDQTSDLSQPFASADKGSIRILGVDDERGLQEVYKKHLGSIGYNVETVSSGREALEKLETDFYDLVISDQNMPEMGGMELLKKVKQRFPDIGFIIVTGFGDLVDAVRAMKLGADDYIAKPIQRDELIILVEAALQKRMLVREIRNLKGHLLEKYGMDKLVGRSRSMMQLFQTARKVADSEATVLIQGESGTGKELLAKAIHFNSPRRNNPLVTIDCGSMPLELLQSELFGHIKGAFTGASRNRRGLFEEARGGTIFLDEIGDIAGPLQLSLLRVLQEREIRPTGSDKTIPVDVRIISASNKFLKDEVERKNFRQDLYYRLAVITLEIPPLRDRREDIPTLTKFFLDRYNKRNAKNVVNVSPAAMNLLFAYKWEGNARELENVLERAVVLAEGDTIGPDLLPPEVRGDSAEKVRSGDDYSLKSISSQASASMEKSAIISALKKSGGNKKKAAEALGISRASLYNKLKSFGIG
ncbi:MAG: sigma-54-dependent Fis family transcriptional regulator [FCB group bacterium]|nr:sigma-54-dependent Fis family transcriptional regulator [FCB group bacterium]